MVAFFFVLVVVLVLRRLVGVIGVVWAVVVAAVWETTGWGGRSRGGRV
jgi:hypothetical protein